MIARLSDFNNIIAKCNDLDEISVNTVITKFSNIVKGVADPRFSKERVYRPCSTFNMNSLSESKYWFDE